MSSLTGLIESTLADVKTYSPPVQTKVKRGQYVGNYSSDMYLPPLKFGSVAFTGSQANELGVQMFPFKRPLTGIYPINTPATLMILDNVTSGENKKGTIRQQTNKFILQQISKPHNEKVQIIETFGKSHVFFYDERTRIYSMQGVMLDAFYQPGGLGDEVPTAPNRFRNMWALGFQDFYNNHLRGWMLKSKGRIAALYTNGWLIKGYPINLVISKESTTMPEGVTFQMNWVIEDEYLLNATSTYNLYNGVKYDTTSASLVNQLNATIDRYNEALANFNNAMTPDKQGMYKAQYEALERTITDLQVQFNASMLKNNQNKSVNDLNYE